MKSKYRTVGGFRNEREASAFLSKIQEKNPNRVYSMKTRTWTGDKRRFYVRELMRKGKKINA